MLVAEKGAELHLRAIPDAAEAEAWYARARGSAPSETPVHTSPALVERRLRSLRYRDFARKRDALVAAYRAGDRSPAALAALDALEAHLLPILAIGLARDVDALRASLRDSMPSETVADAPLLPTLGRRFSPIGRATLTGETAAGDRRNVVFATRPGEWLAYQWHAYAEPDEGAGAALVAVHSAQVAALPALLSTCRPTGKGNVKTTRNRIEIYGASLEEDDAAWEDLYSPVEWGVIDGRGFTLPLVDQSKYELALARPDADDAAIVIVASTLNPFELGLLDGADPEATALELITKLSNKKELRAKRHEVISALAVLRNVAGHPRILAAAEHAMKLSAKVNGLEAIWAQSFVLVAALSPEPLPAFAALVARYETDLDMITPFFAVVRALKNEAMQDLLLERIGREQTHSARWGFLYDGGVMLRAIAKAGSAHAVALLERFAQNGDTPWTRAKATADLLDIRPGDCTLAHALIQFAKRYGELDLSHDHENRGYGTDWDGISEALERHSATCEACRARWVAVLFRIKRSNDEIYRRLRYLAPELCQKLTGVQSEEEIAAWLDAHEQANYSNLQLN